MSRQPKRAGGFTIVEIMIVLAIAGLILLVIFLAIPAVTRNSRNNQRKQDVSLILQAVSHYELNDSGTFPLNCGGASPPCTNSDSDTNYPNDYFLRFSGKDLGYYDPTKIVVTGQSAASPGPSNQPAVTDTETVQVYNYEKCDLVNLGQASTAGAGYNDVVALYALEGSGGKVVSECQQL